MDILKIMMLKKIFINFLLLYFQNSFGQADISYDLDYEEIKLNGKYLKNGTFRRVTKRSNPKVRIINIKMNFISFNVKKQTYKTKNEKHTLNSLEYKEVVQGFVDFFEEIKKCIETFYILNM